MGTDSRKGRKDPSLFDATPAERLDWLEGALAEAYESGALSRPTASEERHPLRAARPTAAKKRRRRKKSGDSSVAWELERAGSHALAFVNAGLPRRDDRRKQKRAPPSKPLATYADAVQWAMRMGVVTAVVGETLSAAASKRPGDAAAAFAELETLRQALLRIFTTVVLKREVADGDLSVLNGCLRRRGREVFPRGDGFCREWGGDGANLDRLIWTLAEAAAELLVSKKLSRVRQCAAKGCSASSSPAAPAAGGATPIPAAAATRGGATWICGGGPAPRPKRRPGATSRLEAERERDREEMAARAKERQAQMAELDRMREERLRESTPEKSP